MLAKYNEIAKRGWYSSDRYSPNNVGLLFERLIGKEADNKSIPDYKGIEIKTVDSVKDSEFTMFCASPDGENVYECRRLWDNYNYWSYKYKDYKIFYCKCFTTKKDNFNRSYYSKLRVDYEKEKVVLEIYEKKELIDEKTSWSFEYLKEILYRKMKNLALIEITRSYSKNDRLYRFNSINFYELKSFEDFLKCIEKGFIHISFRLSAKFENGFMQKLNNHGTNFILDKFKINELFNSISI